MQSPAKLFMLGTAWRFTNTILLVAGLGIFFFLAGMPTVRELIASAGHWGILGAFVTGFFFVSTFTVAPATVVLFSLAHAMNPVELAVAASAGAALGDYVIFRFVKNRLVDEWAPLLHRIADTAIGRVFSSPLFVWLAPVTGALIIASPLPDELGVGLLGAARLESWKMLSLTFLLNTAGIWAIVFFAHTVAPLV